MSEPNITPPNAATEQREAVLGARSRLRGLHADHAPADDIARATAELQQQARAYARHRIIKGLGPDPDALDAETFDDVVDEMSDPGPYTKKIHDRSSCLAHSTMTALLASGAPLAELLQHLRTPGDAFDQDSPFRRLVRQWAERTRPDPFIQQCLDAVAQRDRDFSQAVQDAASLLNSVHIKYQVEHAGADALTVQRGRGGTLELVANSSWDALARSFPDDVREIYANIAAAELAAGRITHAARDINRELVHFFAQLVPRYFALVGRLPRPRRRELTGRTRLTPALAARLVAAIEATDFVADPASCLGFRRPALPRRFRALTALAGYRRVFDIVAGTKVQDASTVVIPPPTPIQQGAST